MWQCRFINHNKATIVVQDVNRGEGYVSMGARGIELPSILFNQFFCEPKISKN